MLSALCGDARACVRLCSDDRLVRQLCLGASAALTAAAAAALLASRGGEPGGAKQVVEGELGRASRLAKVLTGGPPRWCRGTLARQRCRRSVAQWCERRVRSD